MRIYDIITTDKAAFIIIIIIIIITFFLIIVCYTFNNYFKTFKIASEASELMQNIFCLVKDFTPKYEKYINN